MTIDLKNKMILIQAQSSPLKTSCGAQDCPAEILDAAQGSGGAAEHCWIKTGTGLVLDIKRQARLTSCYSGTGARRPAQNAR
jgi:hypothetical protein